jgi:hypothetical protein
VSTLGKLIISGYLDDHGEHIAEHKISKDLFFDLMRIVNGVNPQRAHFNHFIQGFGQEFETYTVRELTEFVELLVKPGLN